MEAAADDDVELEAAAADGNAVVDACPGNVVVERPAEVCDAKLGSCTTAIFATFLFFDAPADDDIANNCNGEKGKEDDQGNVQRCKHELEPKEGYGQKKVKSSRRRGRNAKQRPNERTNDPISAKDGQTTNSTQHPPIGPDRTQQTHSPMIYACVRQEEVLERKSTTYA